MDDIERAKEVKEAEETVGSVDSTMDVEGRGSGNGAGGGDGGPPAESTARIANKLVPTGRRRDRGLRGAVLRTMGKEVMGNEEVTALRQEVSELKGSIDELKAMMVVLSSRV